MGELPFPTWDPVFLDLWGPLDLRYYGLMYVVGFVVGQFILTRLARSGFLPMPPEKVGDLIFALILGVVLGGRLGYCLFYKPEIFSEPLQLLKVWEGGLSFHGGLLGVVFAFVWFGRKHKIPLWRLTDACALAVCPGIFAVRCANFINGELYGRIIRPGDWEPAWAMRFPTDPVAMRLLGIHQASGKREQELQMLKAFEDGTWERVREQVPLRHPSQMYEALAEGLLLGLVLWLVYTWTRKKPLGLGGYGGIFLMGYGLMRFGIEYFRQPDAQFVSKEQPLGTIVFDLSMGQLLCIGMILAGLWMLLFHHGPTPPRTTGEGDPQAPEGSSA